MTDFNSILLAAEFGAYYVPKAVFTIDEHGVPTPAKPINAVRIINDGQ